VCRKLWQHQIAEEEVRIMMKGIIKKRKEHEKCPMMMSDEGSKIVALHGYLLINLIALSFHLALFSSSLRHSFALLR